MIQRPMPKLRVQVKLPTLDDIDDEALDADERAHRLFLRVHTTEASSCAQTLHLPITETIDDMKVIMVAALDSSGTIFSRV